MSAEKALAFHASVGNDLGCSTALLMTNWEIYDYAGQSKSSCTGKKNKNTGCQDVAAGQLNKTELPAFAIDPSTNFKNEVQMRHNNSRTHQLC